MRRRQQRKFTREQLSMILSAAAAGLLKQRRHFNEWDWGRKWVDNSGPCCLIEAVYADHYTTGRPQPRASSGDCVGGWFELTTTQLPLTDPAALLTALEREKLA